MSRVMSFLCAVRIVLADSVNDDGTRIMDWARVQCGEEPSKRWVVETTCKCNTLTHQVEDISVAVPAPSLRICYKESSDELDEC